jgi:hypothetical protein
VIKCPALCGALLLISKKYKNVGGGVIRHDPTIGRCALVEQHDHSNQDHICRTVEFSPRRGQDMGSTVVFIKLLQGGVQKVAVYNMQVYVEIYIVLQSRGRVILSH